MLRKKIGLILTTFALVTACMLGGAMAVMPGTASALTPKQQVCEGISATGGSCDSQAASTTVNNVLKLALNTLSFIAGLIGVIMIIVGGIKYITSQGDASSINSAKNTILYALLGLAVAAVAQFLVRFVLSNAQKAQQPVVQPNATDCRTVSGGPC